jgi:bacillithiol biosynthesis cysteine-adding enzyme BshC
MSERAAFVIDLGALQQPLSPLYRHYLDGSSGAATFYDGGRWDIEAVSAAADRAAAVDRPRGIIAAALVRQQESRGASEAAARAGQLASPETTAVVTGQQPVLFGGPLFVLYKALAAVKVAAELEARRRRPVVPVFWVASDDHDFAEVRASTILDEAGQLRTLRYAPRREPLGQPASHLVLDDTITGLVEELRRALPPSPDRDALVDRIADCYQPGATLAGAFGRLLSSLLPGLVVLDPADPALRPLASTILSREILEGSPSSRLATEVGEALRTAGYHQQVLVRPGFLNLFVVMDGERRALGWTDGGIEIRGSGRRLSPEAAASLLESDPTPWSPGVLLRPIVQDFLLPTAAYVGGPAEIAYHAQIGPSYGHFGVPRPVLLPRPSLTLIEPAQARALEAEDLKLTDLQADPEGLLARWAKDAYPEVEAAFSRVREALGREMSAVETALAALDPTLRAAADASRGRALHQIETLHEKAIRALKKRDQTRAERLRRTRDALCPGGALQERGLATAGLIARRGTAAIDEIREKMDLWAKGHQVLQL